MTVDTLPWATRDDSRTVPESPALMAASDARTKPTKTPQSGRKRKSDRSTARPPKGMRGPHAVSPAVAMEAVTVATQAQPQAKGRPKQAIDKTKWYTVQKGSDVFAKWPKDGVSLDSMTV